MARRQTERIRDLQRGKIPGLGPAISRRPVTVYVRAAQRGARMSTRRRENGSAALRTATRVPAPQRSSVIDVEQALLDRAG